VICAVRAGAIVALVSRFASCSTFGGHDAGPTTGTFHIEITGASSSNVPASFDAQSIVANTFAEPPSDWMCAAGGYTEISAVNGLLRAYVRIPENPPTSTAHQITGNMCGVYVSLTRAPGLPYSERWDPTSGTITFSNVSGQSFDFTITDAAFVSGPGAPAGDAFVANATGHVVGALVH
jgi:hypothetical protein